MSVDETFGQYCNALKLTLLCLISQHPGSTADQIASSLTAQAHWPNKQSENSFHPSSTHQTVLTFEFA